MTEARTKILLGILLIAVAGFVGKTFYDVYVPKSNLPPHQKPVVAENQRFVDIKVFKKPNGIWYASVDYFYKGDSRDAYLIMGVGNPEDHGRVAMMMKGVLKVGRHTEEIEIERPMRPQDRFITRKIWFELVVDRGVGDAKEVDQVIEWADSGNYAIHRESAVASGDDLYSKAVQLINTGGKEYVREAKGYLEKLLLREPKNVPALNEMARVSMKLNWGREGLSQAEKYLLTSLEINPDSVDSKILLGYVYTNQGRFDEAEANFKAVEDSGADNLWLWTNWGDLLQRKGAYEDSLQKFMITINAERKFDRYDNAKLEAYRMSLLSLGKMKAFDKKRDLMRRRAEDFVGYPVFYAVYGEYLLTQYGDFEGGIQYSTISIENGCQCEEAKNVLGMSYYVAATKLKGDEQAVALSQASVFLPQGPGMLYQLAKSDTTSTAVPHLLRDRFSIQDRDSENFNALAYALSSNDLEAARRLVRLGMTFDDLVGPQNYPVGLIAVNNENVEAIKLMKASGVNFTKMKFNGMSAVDYARQSNNQELLEIMLNDKHYAL